MGLHHPEYAVRFARIVTEYEYLEDHMADILAVLLGGYDIQTAGYLLRSILAPRGRYQMMQDLLQLSPLNEKLDDEYDRIIDEFWAIGRERNKYVHGRWFTEPSLTERLYGERVLLSEGDEHGFHFYTRRQVTLKELDVLIGRIRRLGWDIGEVPFDDRAARLRAAGFELDRDTLQWKERPKGADAASPPPPQSSPASPRKKSPKKKG